MRVKKLYLRSIGAAFAVGLVMAEMKYQLCDGFAVNLGPVSIHPRVDGAWEHADEASDREKHPITFRIRTELSRMAQAITLVCD